MHRKSQSLCSSLRTLSSISRSTSGIVQKEVMMQEANRTNTRSSRELDIRPSIPEDWPALRDLYPAAFPEEDLLSLVEELLKMQDGILSLVVLSERGVVVGHVLFTDCSLKDSSSSSNNNNKEEVPLLALLGPLAVHPEFQRQGVGSALVNKGIDLLKQGQRICQVQVLGDPAYYSRFGFVQENRVQPPYDLPDEWRAAWQSLPLVQGIDPSVFADGKLAVPPPWRHPSLWGP